MIWENENLSKWVIDIYIRGPIEIEHNIFFSTRKDIKYNEPLYSDITIKKEKNEIILSVNSFAKDAQLGQKIALIFSGLALDVLSTYIKIPLYASLDKQNQELISLTDKVRRIIPKDEWKFAFEESRLLQFTEPIFLKALGWYRKGLITEDPLDKFLAFWNSIEIVATKYHTKTEKTKQGSKKQIRQCFIDLWGNIENWELIAGNQDWINDNYEIRKNIAHGIKPINIDTIEEITSELQTIEKLVHIFLIEWRAKKLSPEDKVTPEIQEKLEKKG